MRVGCPIRKSQDHSSVTSSPGLIAGSSVLHRLSTPRHPSRALMLGHTNRTPRLPVLGFRLEPSSALTSQSTVGALKGGPPVSPATTGTSGDHEGQHFRLARCIQLLTLLAAFCTPNQRPPCKPDEHLRPGLSTEPAATACSTELAGGHVHPYPVVKEPTWWPGFSPIFPCRFSPRLSP